MIRVGCKIAKKGKRSNINHIEITTIITQTLGHRPHTPRNGVLPKNANSKPYK
jgi:hypothetical protein